MLYVNCNSVKKKKKSRHLARLSKTLALRKKGEHLRCYPSSSFSEYVISLTQINLRKFSKGRKEVKKKRKEEM